MALGLILHGAWAAAQISAAGSNAASAPPPGGGHPPGPPPEAIAACQGKTEGTQVSFKLRNGETLTGVCQKLGNALAARPLGGPPPRGRTRRGSAAVALNRRRPRRLAANA